VQIEKQLSNSSSGDIIGPRAATPSTGKQRVDNGHAAAAAPGVYSPLARINEDEDEVASPDLNAKLEVGRVQYRHLHRHDNAPSLRLSKANLRRSGRVANAWRRSCR
jgi:hypothetical protein